MVVVRKFYFNMVEIAVAIAIVAFGVASMMGLFPTILKQGKRTAEDNQLADVVAWVKSEFDKDYKKYMASNTLSFDDFLDLFEENYEDRSSDPDVSDDDDDDNSAKLIPKKMASPTNLLYYQKTNDTVSNIDFKKRFRVDYLRGSSKKESGESDDDYIKRVMESRSTLASYDIDIKKQPISNLNINGTYYGQSGSGAAVNYGNDYDPGVTIVVRISAPAGVTEEEQEAFYFQYDYYPKD